MTFDQILIQLKLGKSAFRSHWNARHIYIVEGQVLKADERQSFAEIKPNETFVIRPRIDMVFGDDSIAAWVITHEDIFAHDWVILN